jgi:uncharacterized protein (DUF2237 family)
MTGFFRDGCCDTSREDVAATRLCGHDRRVFAFEIPRQRSLDPVPEFGFPACSRAIAGACARLAGKRHSRPASRAEVRQIDAMAVRMRQGLRRRS